VVLQAEQGLCVMGHRPLLFFEKLIRCLIDILGCMQLGWLKYDFYKKYEFDIFILKFAVYHQRLR